MLWHQMLICPQIRKALTRVDSTLSQSRKTLGHSKLIVCLTSKIFQNPMRERKNYTNQIILHKLYLHISLRCGTVINIVNM